MLKVQHHKQLVETATVSCSASSSLKGATHAYPVTTNISDELDAQAQPVPLDVMPFYDTFLDVIPFCERNSIVYKYMSTDELQSFPGCQTEFDSDTDSDADIDDSDIVKEVAEDITEVKKSITIIKSMLKEIRTSVQWINDVLFLGRFIGTYIYVHEVKLSPRMEYKVSKEYTDLAMTRLGNDFLMRQSVMEVENELQALQLPLTSTDCTRHCVIRVQSDREFIQVFNRIIQCSEFWRAGKEAVHVLQPLFQVLHLVEGYRSISGYLYEALKRAQVKIKEGLNKNQEKYEKVWHIFEGYRTKIVHPIHAAAALLNPTYMFSENFEEDIEIKEGIDYFLEKLVASEDREAFVTQMLRYRNKEPRTFTTTAKIMLRTSHPRMWWDYCGDHLPVLRKYAIQMMSQLCTAPSCKQHRLQPEMTDCNDATSMEKYMTSGAQHEESIDLDKLACPECPLAFRATAFKKYAYEFWNGTLYPIDIVRSIDSLEQKL